MRDELIHLAPAVDRHPEPIKKQLFLCKGVTYEGRKSEPFHRACSYALLTSARFLVSQRKIRITLQISDSSEMRFDKLEWYQEIVIKSMEDYQSAYLLVII